MVTEVFLDVSFNAAHWLPTVPASHKCARVHGHTYRLQLRVEGEPDPKTGMVILYEDVRAAWHHVHKALDHRLLNDVDGLAVPTSENIGAWVLERMPMLSSVFVRETEDAGCTVRRPGPAQHPARARIVYLAGPIFGCADPQCRDWRAYARSVLGAGAFLDPMDRDYRGREDEPGIAAEIVEQDKRDIEAASAVLVYFDQPSVGTSMEVLHAWHLGRPVVVANMLGGRVSPWLRYHAAAVAPSLDEALAIVRGQM